MLRSKPQMTSGSSYKNGYFSQNYLDYAIKKAPESVIGFNVTTRGEIVPVTETKDKTDNATHTLFGDAKDQGLLPAQARSIDDYNVGRLGILGTIPAGELAKVMEAKKSENVLQLIKDFSKPSDEKSLSARVEALRVCLGSAFKII